MTGPTCCVGDCCGPGSYCCTHPDNNHEHDTISPEMVEAGAKALAEWDGQDWDAPEWAGEIPRDAFRRGARVVLEAALGDTK